MMKDLSLYCIVLAIAVLIPGLPARSFCASSDYAVSVRPDNTGRQCACRVMPRNSEERRTGCTFPADGPCDCPLCQASAGLFCVCTCRTVFRLVLPVVVCCSGAGNSRGRRQAARIMLPDLRRNAGLSSCEMAPVRLLL